MRSRFLVVGGGLVLALGLGGCGGSGSPATPLTPSPLPPQAVVPAPAPPGPGSNTVPAADAGGPGVYRFDVAMSRSGTATVTLTWPDADFSLQLYLTRGPCAATTGLVTPGACTILGSTRPGSLPGVVTSPVVSGDVVTVWVLNPDGRPQSATVAVEVN